MSDYTRDFRLLHPLLIEALNRLTEGIRSALPLGTTIRPISGHRTPAEQFEIFKKGRTRVDGHWEKTGATFTNKDGFESLSHHNYLPCLAVDFGLFTQDGDYVKDGNAYRGIGPVAEGLGFEWGGRWSNPFDPAHVQISANRLIGQSLARGSALVWQEMLAELDHYKGELDGYFGDASTRALESAIGEAVRTPAAYLKLLKLMALRNESL